MALNIGKYFSFIIVTAFIFVLYVKNYNKKTEVKYYEKFKKILIHSFFFIFFALGITPITKVLAEGTEAISNPNPNISVTRAYTGDVTPFKTNYGNGGYTKIELYGNGREVWWSVKPNTSQSYTYSGLITVTFSDNSTRIYPVSKSGSGGQSVSGSFELPKS